MLLFGHFDYLIINFWSFWDNMFLLFLVNMKPRSVSSLDQYNSFRPKLPNKSYTSQHQLYLISHFSSSLLGCYFTKLSYKELDLVSSSRITLFYQWFGGTSACFSASSLTCNRICIGMCIDPCFLRLPWKHNPNTYSQGFVGKGKKKFTS